MIAGSPSSGVVRRLAGSQDVVSIVIAVVAGSGRSRSLRSYIRLLRRGHPESLAQSLGVRVKLMPFFHEARLRDYLSVRPHQYVGYYRVSSPTQGKSGLGLQGQREAVHRLVEEKNGKLVAEFSEVRSGLKSAGRQLREALRICRMRRATLVVAAIDRLSRRMALTTALLDSDIALAVVDSPNGSRLLLQIKAAWAEKESFRISERVTAALAELRKRGVKLGQKRPIEALRQMGRIGRREWMALAKARVMEIAPALWKLRAEGATLGSIATALNWENVPTPQGRRWYPSSVGRALHMTEAEFPAMAAAARRRPNYRVARADEFASRIGSLIWRHRLSGMSKGAIARELTRRGIATRLGGQWRVNTIARMLDRTAAQFAPDADLTAATIRQGQLANKTAWIWEVAPIAWELRGVGLSLQRIARELNRRNIRAANRRRWHGKEIKTVLQATRHAFSAQAEAITAAGHRLWPADRNEHAATVVPLIARLRKLGKSYAAIAEELNQRNIPTTTSGRWYGATARRALQLADRRSLSMRSAA
jgi:DNA invertase Pin-like site-specific DNA recombinase